MIYRLKYLITSIIIIFISDCGVYSFKGSLPDNIKTIYLSPVKNSTSEYILSNMLNEKIRKQLINKNILKIGDFYTSDSKLDIAINLVEDVPSSYVSDINTYDVIKQWKINVHINMVWSNNHKSDIISNEVIKEWAMYDNSGLDIGSDGIDNDGDGLIDAEDSDEYGSSREAALRIIVDNIINSIIEELISNW